MVRLKHYENIHPEDIELYQIGGWTVVTDTDRNGEENWRIVKDNSPANCVLRPYTETNQSDPPMIHGQWILSFDDPNIGNSNSRNAVGVMLLQKGKMLADWCDSVPPNKRSEKEYDE